MKAEPADQAKLLDLADLDMSLARNQQAHKNAPEIQQVVDLERELATSRSAMREALAAVDELRAEMRRAQNDVELVETRIARDTQRLDSSASVKDVQGLQHEIESLRERLAIVEEVQLEVMERLEQAEAALAESEATTARVEVQLSEAANRRDRELASLEAERAELQSSRSALIATLPEDLVDLYERQRERYGVGASLLRAGISSASGVKLTESDLQHVRQAQPNDVVLCPDSNAILVRTHESGLT